MQPTAIEPIEILLVEDSPGDVNLTIEALRGARVANSYVTKPVAFDEFIAAIRSIEGFWLSIVRLPLPRGAAAHE
jgi:hypothetical protein